MSNNNLADGFRLDLTVVNPINDKVIPVFVADYVVKDYGTGAVMGVPSVDKRDLSFAKRNGINFDAEQSGQDVRSLKCLQDEGIIKVCTEWKLRDWCVSRQRPWGTPIPIIYCEKCGPLSVPEEDLPVVFPDEIFKYIGAGRERMMSEKAIRDFASCQCPKCHGKGTRCLDTLDTFVDSSWYFLAFCASPNFHSFPEKDIMHKWCKSSGVDIYVGGIEHAVLHLLYARFVNMFLFDVHLLKNEEPFKKLITQGMVLGKTFVNKKTGQYLNPKVQIFDENTDIDIVYEKMSKSKFNGVDPTELVEKFGPDALRLFILFAGPSRKDIVFDESGLIGQQRFLNKVQTLVANFCQSTDKQKDLTQSQNEIRNRAIANVNKNLFHRVHLNVAVSDLMKFSNAIQDGNMSCGKGIETLIILLAPFAPFTAEKCFQQLKSYGGLSPENSVLDTVFAARYPQVSAADSNT